MKNNMSKVIIIGAGGVGNVVAHKCAGVPAVFEDILLASRTESKCQAIARDVMEKQGRHTHGSNRCRRCGGND